MKTTGWLLLGLALGGAGCLNTPTAVVDEGKRNPRAQQEEFLPPPPPPVTADRITEANALEQARALRREIERADAPRPAAPAPAPPDARD